MDIKKDPKENIGYVDNILYDSLVIGTGTSSEPVIYHLSKTNLKTLIIDRSNLYKSYDEVDKKKKLVFGITPKQIFSKLNIQDKKSYIPISYNVLLKCENFSYVHSNVSGGLSNFWGGGLFNWPDSEIKKATNLPVESVKDSYLNISKRIKILNRNQMLEKSYFSNNFLKEQEKSLPRIFHPSNFFISENGLKNHKFKKQEYDQHLIWKSSHSIRKYIKNSTNMKYLSATTAVSIRKYKNYYEIYCYQGKYLKKIRSKSIFLCSGVVNSTYLAFSILNLKKEQFKLNHSLAAITPFVFIGLLPRFNRNNINLPDLSWSLVSQGKNISGYLLSSFFIHTKIIKKLRNNFFRKIYSIFENILSSFAFITTFSNSNQTNTKLIINRINENKSDLDHFSIKMINTNDINDSKRYLKHKLKYLKKYIKGNFFLITFLTQITKYGGDIHYGSTMPEKNLMESPINTSLIGEIENANNIYACDASRLAFISSLPHTFTVMAVIDSSMPLIIKKIKKI